MILMSFGEQLLFDNEEDWLAEIDKYKVANRGEYNLNQADDDCLLDDYSPSTFPTM